MTWVCEYIENHASLYVKSKKPRSKQEFVPLNIDKRIYIGLLYFYYMFNEDLYRPRVKIMLTKINR